jgi:hypothetical protein
MKYVRVPSDMKVINAKVLTSEVVQYMYESEIANSEVVSHKMHHALAKSDLHFSIMYVKVTCWVQGQQKWL